MSLRTGYHVALLHRFPCSGYRDTTFVAQRRADTAHTRRVRATPRELRLICCQCKKPHNKTFPNDVDHDSYIKAVGLLCTHLNIPDDGWSVCGHPFCRNCYLVYDNEDAVGHRTWFKLLGGLDPRPFAETAYFWLCNGCQKKKRLTWEPVAPEGRQARRVQPDLLRATSSSMKCRGNSASGCRGQLTAATLVLNPYSEFLGTYDATTVFPGGPWDWHCRQHRLLRAEGSASTQSGAAQDGAGAGIGGGAATPGDEDECPSPQFLTIEHLTILEEQIRNGWENHFAVPQ